MRYIFLSLLLILLPSCATIVGYDIQRGRYCFPCLEATGKTYRRGIGLSLLDGDYFPTIIWKDKIAETEWSSFLGN